MRPARRHLVKFVISQSDSKPVSHQRETGFADCRQELFPKWNWFNKRACSVLREASTYYYLDAIPVGYRVNSAEPTIDCQLGKKLP